MDTPARFAVNTCISIVTSDPPVPIAISARRGVQAHRKRSMIVIAGPVQIAGLI
jgi:hypothetical protein